MAAEYDSVFNPVKRVESGRTVLSETKLSGALIFRSLHELCSEVIVTKPIYIRFWQAEDSKLVSLLSYNTSTVCDQIVG